MPSWLSLRRCARFATLPGTAGLAYAYNLRPGPVAQTFLIFVGGALVAGHIVAAFGRVWLKQWQIPGIRPLLVEELVLGVVVPTVGILLPLRLFGSVSKWPCAFPLLVCVALGLLLVHGFYSGLQKAIAEQVKDGDGTLVSDRVKNWRPHRPFGDRRRVRDVDPKAEDMGLLKLLAILTQPRRQGDFTRMRAIFLALISSAALLTANMATALEIHHLAKPANSTEEESGTGGGGSEEGGKGSGGVGEGGSSGGEGHAESSCELTLAGAPRWAREALRQLYLGEPELEETTAPPGFHFGGCPGLPRVLLHGTFVFLVGRKPSGEVASVAVDSIKFGPEIFLAPAAKHVLALIEEGVKPIGGHPRLFPAGGDAVTIETPDGTIASVRAAEHPSGRAGIATAYVEMPPSVTMAWMGAMGEAERWLWPLGPESSGEDVVYPLAETKEGRPRYLVHYDSATGTATRDDYFYPAFQTQLGYSELKEWVHTAAQK